MLTIEPRISCLRIRVAAAGSAAANPAFDVTPARLVTGLITERGRVAANEAALAALYPERPGANIRFSFSRFTTADEVDRTVAVLKRILQPVPVNA